MKRSATTTIAIGKTTQRLAALRGGGSALPGLVVEKLDAHFLRDILATLPDGVVLVSGTNGKTTTTKIVSDLLRANGKRVLTNKSGSNFQRGVIASVLRAVEKSGNLPYDIAVLELDEAHAVHFVREIKPDYSLILNVMRDQLDRFGEIDTTTEMLRKIVQSTQEGVVLNRDDPRVASLADSVSKDVTVEYFGADKSLQSLFLSDDELHAAAAVAPKKPASANYHHRGDVELHSIEKPSESRVTYKIGTKEYPATLRLNGAYNYLNAAGALALCRMILPDDAIATDKLVASLQDVTPAFGRGETLLIDDRHVELVLVKNPAGFRLALESFVSENSDTMIAINDAYADGRDMSWLWDVDFSSLGTDGRSVTMVSGVRAFDMALRLQYDEVLVGKVEPDLATAANEFIDSTSRPLRIFCTYTAMLKLRRVLTKRAGGKHTL